MKFILPKYFDSEWSLCQLRVIDNYSICAIKDSKVILVSKEGSYYLAEMDLKNGSCKILQ